MGIEKLNMKGVDVYKRTFVEVIISVSYFRIIEFREKFLSIILEKSNRNVEEWRATEGWPLEYEEDEDQYNEESWQYQAITHMFDWKTYCYDIVSED